MCSDYATCTKPQSLRICVVSPVLIFVIRLLLYPGGIGVVHLWGALYFSWN